MKRLILSFLAISLILTQLALAQDFSIDLEMKEEYLATHDDYLKLTIKNPLQEGWFTISVIGFPQEWVVAEESLLKVPASGSGTILIHVKPARDALPNIYQYFLKVKRLSTGSVIEDNLLINVKQITSAILKDVSLSCETCLDDITISGTIHNVGSKLLTNLALVAKVANRQKTFPIEKLGVLESEEFEITFSLEDMNPGDYDIDLNLVDNVGKNLYTETGLFKIPVVENVIYDKEVSATPFGASITVLAINKGNIVSDADLESVSPQGWYYLLSGPTPTGMMLGKYYWRTTLAPNETKSITYSEIYWPTYVLIIAAVLIGVFIYWQSTALVFSKRLIKKRGNEASVSLHLRSKKKGVDKVIVKDVVPSEFSIVSRFETIKPIIRKIADGVELNWKLGKLTPHEERVLHYTIKPAKELFKKVKLPSARARGVRHKAPLYKFSNRVSIHPRKQEKKFVAVEVKE